MTAVHEERHGDYVIEIHIDGDPFSPRDDDNTSTMVCFHKRYNLGDKHSYNEKDYASWGELYDAIEADDKPILIRPLYMYDHSGLAFRMGTGFNDIDSGGWDWGQVGWIYVSKDSFDAERPVLSGVMPQTETEEETLARCLKLMESELETYAQYVNGEVYGFVISKIEVCSHGDEHREEIDSCWGFYGQDYCLQEALACLPKGQP